MATSVHGNAKLRETLQDQESQLQTNASILESLLAHSFPQAAQLLTANQVLRQTLQTLEVETDELQSTALLQQLSHVFEEQRLLTEIQEDFEVTQKELLQGIQAKGKQLAARRKEVAQRRDYLETVRRSYKMDARTASSRSVALLSQVEGFKECFRHKASQLFRHLGLLTSLRQSVAALELEVNRARILLRNPVNRGRTSLNEVLASVSQCGPSPRQSYYDQAKQLQIGLSLPSDSPEKRSRLEFKTEVKRMGTVIEEELRELLALQRANEDQREENRILAVNYIQKSRQTGKAEPRMSIQTAGSAAELGI